MPQKAFCGAAVFLGITEEVFPIGKVGGVEGLKPVSCNDLLQKRSFLTGKPRIHIVHEFADYHGRRDGAVVLDALSHITDVQGPSCREDGLQKNIPVIIAAGAVSRSGVPGHEVKAQCPGLPGIGIVVHADVADDLEGNTPHGQHGAKSHTAGHKPQSEPFFLEEAFQVPSYEINAHRLMEIGLVLPFPQLGNGLPDNPHLLRPLIHWHEKRFQHFLQGVGPGPQGAGCAERRDPFKELMGKGRKPSQHLCIAPLHQVIGEKPFKEFPVPVGHGIAQKEPVQAGSPGILRQGGQAHFPPVLLINAPPDACLQDPSPDMPQIRLGQPESGMDGWGFQYRHDL